MSGERILFPWKPDDESGGGDGTSITLLAEKFIVADDTDNAYTVTGIPEGVESVHLNGVFLDPDYWTLSGTEISTTHAVDAGADRRVGHGDKPHQKRGVT